MADAEASWRLCCFGQARGDGGVSAGRVGEGQAGWRCRAGVRTVKWLEGCHGGCDERKEVWSQIVEGLVCRVKKFEGRVVMVATGLRGCHGVRHLMESDLSHSICKVWDDNDCFTELVILTNE